MELTRKQLYNMMWTDGVGQTEKALGLKQIELKRFAKNSRFLVQQVDIGPC